MLAVTVAGFIAVLKRAVTGVVRATPVAPGSGVWATTVGTVGKPPASSAICWKMALAAW